MAHLERGQEQNEQEPYTATGEPVSKLEGVYKLKPHWTLVYLVFLSLVSFPRNFLLKNRFINMTKPTRDLANSKGMTDQ